MFRYSKDHAIAVAEELENEIFGANATEGERVGEAAAVIRSLVEDRETLVDRSTTLEETAARLNAELNSTRMARPLSEWKQEQGPVLWIKRPFDGRMWFGSPLDQGYPGAYAYWLPVPKADSIYMPVTRGM